MGEYVNERSNDMLQSKKQSVFLVGAKSLGNYGGYETFVDKLTEYHQNNTSIKYYVACKANGDGCIDEKKLTDIKRNSDNEFTYHNAICFSPKFMNFFIKMFCKWSNSTRHYIYYRIFYFIFFNIFTRFF